MIKQFLNTTDSSRIIELGFFCSIFQQVILLPSPLYGWGVDLNTSHEVVAVSVRLLRLSCQNSDVGIRVNYLSGLKLLRLSRTDNI